MSDYLTPDDIRRAVTRARITLQTADQQASTLASILHGRLRHVSPYVLADLKKELSQFNAHTKEWKS